MGSLVKIYNTFLSKEILYRIENELNSLKIQDYKNIKSLLSWLPEQIIKEKKVIKYAEEISGLNFSVLSKETRSHIAIKYGLIAEDTQIHFDNRVLLNIVVPIYIRDLKGSGLLIFPKYSSFLLRPILKFKIVSKIFRKFKFLQSIFRAQNIDYFPNKGYIFKGNMFAHGVFYRPKSKKSFRAVLTINFKK